MAPAQVDALLGSVARVEWPFPTPAGSWVEAVGLGSLRRRVDFLIGAVLLIRSEALDDVGPFDEEFFLYAEEIDWQRRARTRGWQVALCREVTATHVGAGTGGNAVELSGALVRALMLPRERGRRAAARFHLYRSGPLRVESRLDDGRPLSNAGPDSTTSA